MISIVIPVYNVEKYLERCIQSVLKQSYHDLELIIIDDGSTDKSGEICDKYQYDDRVRVIHQKNLGVSASRNLGIEISQGDYIWFIDADDWIEENSISTLVNEGENSDLIFFGAMTAIENSDETFTLEKRVFWNDKKSYKVIDKYQEIFNKNVTLWNKLIKKEVIGDIRFDESMRYGEDCDFLYRVLENVDSAMIVPHEIYYYFVNRSGNVVSSKLDDRSLELLENTKRLYNDLSSLHVSSSAIRRIFIVVNEVLSKVPLTQDGIKDSKRYINASRKLMFYPRMSDLIKFVFDKQIERWIRFKYIKIMINPFYLNLKLLKKH